jgi:hypothetical protein
MADELFLFRAHTTSVLHTCNILFIVDPDMKIEIW